MNRGNSWRQRASSGGRGRWAPLEGLRTACPLRLPQIFRAPAVCQAQWPHREADIQASEMELSLRSLDCERDASQYPHLSKDRCTKHKAGGVINIRQVSASPGAPLMAALP